VRRPHPVTDRLGAIQAKPGDLSPLRIEETIVRKMLLGFLRDEAAKAGYRKAIVNVSGGIDSAVVVYLAAEAYGPEQVTALLLPYRLSEGHSLADARLVVRELGVRAEELDITAQIDAYFAREGGVEKVDQIRAGNKLARERMAILYDRSRIHAALPLGTSNKTELLLGYGTIYGDMASAINPVGDLYKTQLRELATFLGVPERIREKAPTADLWVGQTDEAELGATYAELDLILYHMVDRRLSPSELVEAGFEEKLVQVVRGRMRRNHFKRVPPLIAKVSLRTIGHDFLYPRDWEQ
jgi:NAD+ synthase